MLTAKNMEHSNRLAALEMTVHDVCDVEQTEIYAVPIT
jgi:hypothetical protein